MVLRCPRRVGKTILLRQIIEALLASGVAASRILYVPFDELPTLVRIAEPVLAIARWFERNHLGTTFNVMARKGTPAFLFAPFAYAAPFVARGPAAAVIYAGFLAWVVYAISLLVRRGRVNIPRAVISFIAGISLLDALLIAGAGRAALAVGAVGGFGLTLAGQRWVRGT